MGGEPDQGAAARVPPDPRVGRVRAAVALPTPHLEKNRVRLLQQPESAAEGRSVDPVLAVEKLNAGAFRRIDHRPRVGLSHPQHLATVATGNVGVARVLRQILAGIGGQGLGADDVLAGRGGRLGHPPVQAVGDAEIDDIDQRIREHRVEVVEHGRHVETARVVLGTFATPRDDAGDAG